MKRAKLCNWSRKQKCSRKTWWWTHKSTSSQYVNVHTANPISFEEIEPSSQQAQLKKENESQQKEENGSQQKEKNKSIDEVDMADDNRETPDDNEIPENDTNQIQISNKVERINHNKNDAPTATNKTVSIYLHSNCVSHTNWQIQMNFKKVLFIAKQEKLLGSIVLISIYSHQRITK